VLKLNLEIVDDIPLSNNLSVQFCDDCNFYYSNSDNVQEDYDLYYKTFNNYKNYNNCLDKDERCCIFLDEFISKNNINTIIDYGSGNGDLSKMLSKKYNVDVYDIDMKKNTNEYDFLILSHVLEHIYNLNEFVDTISLNIKDNGYLYIEVPNAEYYNEFNDLCPLQEINLEHINFFSKYALNKLLLNKGFICINLIDDYFLLNDSKYHIIRGVFKKNSKNVSLLEYIESGNDIIKKYNIKRLSEFEYIYIYGCGQFLFKLFNEIQKHSNIKNIVDDNKCYENRKIKDINIIDGNALFDKITDGDTVVITSLVHSKSIKEKLLKLGKSLNILLISEL